MSKGKVILIKNAMLMTVTSLALRLVGMVFRVWLASAVGAEGMGLYQQIFSVYAFISVFASSGIGLVVTRLVSEEITLGCRRGVDMIIARSVFLTLLVAILSGGAVLGFAEQISVYIISDSRATLSLQIMTASLPFMGVSAVLKGYFFARKKAFPNSTSQILEQAVRIVLIVSLIGSKEASVEDGCATVLFADAVAEASSFIYLLIYYAVDRRKLKKTGGRHRPPFKIFREVLRISSPIAGGKYLNSFLRTIENMIVPTGLVAYGLSRADALSEFGMIKGMALPLLLFPAGLLSSITTLLVPEIAEANAFGKKERVKSTAERSLALTFIFSIPFAVGFFFTAEMLSTLIYKEAGVGRMVRLLAPLVPLMYVDSVSDALLKSLDCQMDTFRHAILDSIGRIILILVSLSRFGMNGFIAIMYISNIFTSILNLVQLLQVSGAKIRLYQYILIPLVKTLTVALLGNFIAGLLNLNSVVYIMFIFAIILIFYLPYLLRTLKTLL